MGGRKLTGCLMCDRLECVKEAPTQRDETLIALRCRSGSEVADTAGCNQPVRFAGKTPPVRLYRADIKVQIQRGPTHSHTRQGRERGDESDYHLLRWDKIGTA